MLEGAFGVVLTPFTPRGTVDYDALERELDFLLRSEIPGFFVCGTTGEFVHLSPEENAAVLQFCAKRLGGKKTLLAGACASDVNTSAFYMRCAQEAGYRAAVVCPPYYFTRSQEDIVRFYRALCKLEICDLVLYNIPFFTAPIARESFLTLLEEERVIAMKDSSANMKQICHEIDLAKRVRPDFSILSGTDDCLVPALAAGCKGSTTAFSVILPEINAEIYRLFYAGKIQEAMALNQSCLPLLRLAEEVMFPTGYKMIFRERGFQMGDCQPNDEEKIRWIAPLIHQELERLLGDAAFIG